MPNGIEKFFKKVLKNTKCARLQGADGRKGYGILHEGKLLQEITATELDKRCKKHLLLQVNDVAAASVLLESKLNTSNFSVMPDKSIHLYDYVENAGKVSALLSANNITIYQLAQSGDSLETYYTNLIGGCQND